MKEKSIKERYNDIVDEYIQLFNIKHESDLEYWVSDQIGTIACIGDCYFDFEEIRYDIDNNLPEKLIYEWYYYVTDYMFYHDKAHCINFTSYIKGARYQPKKNLFIRLINKYKQHQRFKKNWKIKQKEFKSIIEDITNKNNLNKF